MLRKVSLLALLLVLVFASVSLADVPEKGQWAYAGNATLRLYEKADVKSGYTKVKFPEEWIKVPSVVRDKNNHLWYKVNINDKSGWLQQDGVMLKMGSKSKTASNIYNKNYVKARQQVVNRKVKGWRLEEEEDGFITYSTDGGSFQLYKEDGKTEDSYFESSDGEICKFFFGFDPIGMTENEIRSKLGTPTLRYSPLEEPETSVFYYELDGSDLILGVNLYQENNKGDFTVETIIMLDHLEF